MSKHRIKISNNREVTARAISAISAALYASFLSLSDSVVDQVFPYLEALMRSTSMISKPWCRRRRRI